MSTGSQQVERFCLGVGGVMSPELVPTAGGPDVLPNPVPAPDPEPPKPDPTPEPSPVSPAPEPAPAFSDQGHWHLRTQRRHYHVTLLRRLTAIYL